MAASSSGNADGPRIDLTELFGAGDLHWRPAGWDMVPAIGDALSSTQWSTYWNGLGDDKRLEIAWKVALSSRAWADDRGLDLASLTPDECNRFVREAIREPASRLVGEYVRECEGIAAEAQAAIDGGSHAHVWGLDDSHVVNYMLDRGLDPEDSYLRGRVTEAMEDAMESAWQADGYEMIDERLDDLRSQVEEGRDPTGPSRSLTD
jgi:hypothetical protein